MKEEIWENFGMPPMRRAAKWPISLKTLRTAALWTAPPELPCITSFRDKTHVSSHSDFQS